MARIRSIKPEFFLSLTVAALPLTARLTFIGLWTHVDDEGRCVDDARLVKAAVWPLDDRTAAEVEGDLKLLSESSLIHRYRVGERSYLAVQGWREHQRINRPTKSKLPPPPGPAADPPDVQSEQVKPPPASVNGATPHPSLIPHGVLTEDSPPEGNREQGTGNREVPPTAAELPLGDQVGESVTQRSKRITDAYAAAEPMCRWPAVNGIVIKAIKSGRYADDEIHDALLRLAAEQRAVTVESLRTELNGLPPGNAVAVRRRDGPQHSTTDARVAQGLTLAAQLDANPDLLKELR